MANPALVDALIDPDRLPHTVLRTGETLLKRRTFAVERNAVLRLQSLYRDAYRDVVAALGDMERSAFRSYVEGRVQRLHYDVLRVVEQAARTALVGNYYGRLWLLDVATKDSVRVNMPPLTPDALREDYYDDLIRELLGKRWRDQYALEMDDLTLRIRRAIGSGLVDGEDMAGIQRRVRDAMGISTDRRRGRVGSAERRSYRQNFNRVQVLTRTVVQTTSSRGSMAAYRANADIIDGTNHLTAHDERTCPQCAALDGKFYPLKSNRDLPPIHPQCRCTRIAHIKDDAMEAPDRATRVSLKKWAAGYGIEREIAAFLVPRT